jgi:hypothetical protein
MGLVRLKAYPSLVALLVNRGYERRDENPPFCKDGLRVREIRFYVRGVSRTAPSPPCLSNGYTFSSSSSTLPQPVLTQSRT